MGDGMMLGPLTWSTAVGEWTMSWLPTIAFVVLAVGYVVLAAKRPASRKWPVARTASFLGGAVVGLLAVNSFIAVYAMTLYWLHMVQHLVLIMVVPFLFVLGRPLTLLAETGERARKVVRGKAFGAATMPGVSLVVYALVLVGTHLTGFMSSMRDHPWLHVVEVALYVLAGFLYFVTLLVDEPVRWELSYPLRLFLMMMGMAVDTIVGVILMMTVHDPAGVSGMMPRDWGPSPLGDLNSGGAIMWVFGDALMLVTMLVVIGRWLSDPAGGGMGKWLESARSQHLAEVADTERTEGTIDDDAASLDAYNRMLRRLHDGDPRS